MSDFFKKSIRKDIATKIASYTDFEKAKASQIAAEKVLSMPEFKESSIVLAYLPTTNEADCTDIIKEALAQKKTVAIPKIDSALMAQQQYQIDFYVLNAQKEIEEQTQEGPYGILEPDESCPKITFMELDSIFMLVPGVAFSINGKRLGHGKGFYDRYIDSLHKKDLKPYLCGFCLPCQILSDIPTEDHDISMNTVVY